MITHRASPPVYQSKSTPQRGAWFRSQRLRLWSNRAGMVYCHGSSCRRWSAGPVNAFTLWNPQNVRITRGADNIGTYNKSPMSYRKWCKTCGGHIFTEHPPLGLTDVYAAVIPDLPFPPGLPGNYREAGLQLRRRPPKLQ